MVADGGCAASDGDRGCNPMPETSRTGKSERALKDRLILSPPPCSYGWEKFRKERTYETKRTYRESNPVKVRAQAGGWGDKRPPRLAQGSPRTFPGLYFIGFRAVAGVRRCCLILSICPAPGANKKIFANLPRRNVREFSGVLGGLVLPRWVQRSRLCP